jgi:hypothetical protein
LIGPQDLFPSQHQYQFEDLAPDDFERLIYQLIERCGEFDTVEWYGGTRARGRDVIAYRQTDAGRQKWYFQCQPYVRVTYEVAQNDLNRLAQHMAEEPDFAPDVIVFATACPVPAEVTDQAAIYANQLGLPEPYFWDQGALDRMLKSQPETEREYFGWNRFLRRHLTESVVRAPCGCQVTAGLLVILAIGAGVLLSQRAVPLLGGRASTPPTATPAVTYTLTPTTDSPTRTPTAVAVSPTATPVPDRPSPTPTSTPLPPTNTPTPIPEQPVGTPTSTPTRRPTRTPTPTPTPSPIPTFVPPEPILLEPSPGVTFRQGTVFRWQGGLGYAQGYVIRFRHLESGWVWDNGPFVTDCLEVMLPADRYGGWAWQIRVVSGDTTLAESQESYFWLDPFPRVPLPPVPTPRPCGE